MTDITVDEVFRAASGLFRTTEPEVVELRVAGGDVPEA
jgi:hypothetical protein